MMTPDELIESHLWMIDNAVSHERRKRGTALEEVRSIAGFALVQAAHSWKDYCVRHGYSADNTGYFIAYAKRRIQGAILDEWRELDSLTRADRTKTKRDPSYEAPPSQMRKPVHLEAMWSDRGHGGVSAYVEPGNHPTVPKAADAFGYIFAQDAMDQAERYLRGLPLGFQVALALKLNDARFDLWAEDKHSTSHGQVATVAALMLQDELSEMMDCPSLIEDNIFKQRAKAIRKGETWTDDGSLVEALGLSVDALLDNFYYELRTDVATLAVILRIARDSNSRHHSLRNRRDAGQPRGKRPAQASPEATTQAEAA